jgi:hypothetical protein
MEIKHEIVAALSENRSSTTHSQLGTGEEKTMRKTTNDYSSPACNHSR